MASQEIAPLRIQKSSNGTPRKMPTPTGRPLSELSPMALRRNSPSFPQAKHLNDSSPVAAAVSAASAAAPAAAGPGSSPFSNGTNSPKLFWQRRDMVSPARENQSPDGHSLSSAKRSSIENLKKASRVKNSGIFALEQEKNYDPSRPSILDGKPAPRKENVAPAATDDKDEGASLAALVPSKKAASPKKSSLSKRGGASFRNSTFDPDTGIWADDQEADDSNSDKTLSGGRGLHSHAKSVTFDHGPPQINEYEMVTPDPSSVASGSREGSYESFGDGDDGDDGDDDDDDDDNDGFERGMSADMDDSFDASLEDADKTPVVMPEDWRFMSPEYADAQLTHAHLEEDAFGREYGSPAPDANPGDLSTRAHQTSLASVDSNGQTRPLPPLPAPPSLAPSVKQSPSRDSLSGTFERMSGHFRHQHSSPPSVKPAISKSDLRQMSLTSMSIEDRLRILMETQKPSPSPSPERGSSKAASQSLVRAGSEPRQPSLSGEPGPEVVDDADDDDDDDEAVAREAESHISRDSILRHMRSNNELRNSSNSEHSSYASCDVAYDPDIPIPSMEDPTVNPDVMIKQEQSDEVDLYSIADIYRRPSDIESIASDDVESDYSQPSLPSQPVLAEAAWAEANHDTPRARSPAAVQEQQENTKWLAADPISLPDFSDFGDSDGSFNIEFASYLTRTASKDSAKSSSAAPKEPVRLPDLTALRTSIQRPFTPQEQLPPPPPNPTWADEEPGTPDSVIRHPLTPKQSHTPPPRVPPKDDIVDPVTDVQNGLRNMSLGGSSTDSSKPKALEEHAKAAAPEQQPTHKRVTSLVQLDIPLSDPNEDLSFGLEKEFDRVVEVQKVEFERSLRRLHYPFHGRFPSAEMPDSRAQAAAFLHDDGKPLLPAPLNLARPLRGSFANRSPLRQRGYLMRQNTKVVVASERSSQDEPRPFWYGEGGQQHGTKDEQADIAASLEPNKVVASPRNISQPTWVAEPWNGKARRKSIRVGGGGGGEKTVTKRKPADGPAPPLPGQPSNVQQAGLDSVAESDVAEDEADEVEDDGVERGRLFVKVVGVKDLDLPFPKNESVQFALTLDNGLHCVTTTWLDLAKSAPIGQEFELVVLNDLEFQLTLQVKLEQPPAPAPPVEQQQRAPSPTKIPMSPAKQNVFGRLFGSPKKKKEGSISHASAHAIAAPVLPRAPPSAYDLLHGLVAKDGAFARAYVALSEHEQQAYGRPYSVDITCFNEWAMEEVHVGSSRSKKSVTPQLRQRPPYAIGKLELLLLYVPKPRGAKDEDMPKSMNGAVRALREAEERLQQQAQIRDFEGTLSQQGGDCPYWRRRYFKLAGTKLTAYHETTRQPRATINLAKATKLIDDKSALAQRETSTKGGGRRKSGFAEEEEGYMFIEEGFRIRFANGEVIDFYADSAAQKDEWMKALGQVVGKGIPSTSSSSSASSGQAKPWVDMVLKREKCMRAKTLKAPVAPAVPERQSSREQQGNHDDDHASRLGNSGIPLPTRPAGAGHARSESYHTDSGRKTGSSPAKHAGSVTDRARKTKSMLM